MNQLFARASLIYGLGLSTVLVPPALALPHKATIKKQGKYLDQGVIVGGRAGRGFSLLNVRRDIAKDQSLERIIMDIGDFKGKPHMGRAGYFHASIHSHPPRIILDMHQVVSTALDEAQLRRMFSQSPFVRRLSLVADPEDHTTSIILDLKSTAAVDVFELPSNKKSPSRVVVDLKRKAGGK